MRRVGGLIQVAFAAFWLVRGGLAIGGPAGAAVIALSGASVAGVFAYAIRVTAGTAPRPRGRAARRIERGVTVATVLQLAASFALPYAAIAAGHADWVLPSIAFTIGPLLLWLDRRVGIPRYCPVGWTMILAPVLLLAALSGTALVATTGIAAGLLLLATGAAGFRDLALSARR